MKTKNFLPLELDEELVNEKIVTKYVYDLEASFLVIEFNKEYDGRTITSTIDLDNWENSVESLQKKLAIEGY